MAGVAALPDDRGQDVVDDLDPRDVEPLLDAQQTAADQLVERPRWDARVAQCPTGAVQRDALAEPGIAEQPVFDKGAQGRRVIGKAALVETRDDVVAAAGEEIGADPVEPAGDAALVELAADEAQQ